MASSRKKVILRTTAHEVRPGYLPATGLLQSVDGQSAVTLLDLEGRIDLISLAAVRWIAYVRDFNLTDKDDPERLSRRTFLARPRTEGLWVRLTLTDGSIFEGLAPINLSLLDNTLDDNGIFLIPPDIRSNTQRLYIPRHQIADMKMVAVVTTPSKPKSTESEAVSQQAALFPDSNRG